jgi:uncharacterized membrane protein
MRVFSVLLRALFQGRAVILAIDWWFLERVLVGGAFFDVSNGG